MKEYQSTLDLESVKEANIKQFISSNDILIDLKIILKNYYVATFNEEGNALKITFNNGQSFIINVTQV